MNRKRRTTIERHAKVTKLRKFDSSAQWPGARCYAGEVDWDKASKDLVILLYIQESHGEGRSQGIFTSVCSASLAHSAVLTPDGMGKFLTVNSLLFSGLQALDIPWYKINSL